VNWNFLEPAGFNVDLVAAFLIPFTIALAIVVLGESCKVKLKSDADVELVPAPIFHGLRQSQVFFQIFKDVYQKGFSKRTGCHL